MTDKLLVEINKKLEIIIKLFAKKMIEKKSDKISIIELKDFGLDNSLIAEIVGTTPKVVSVRLSEAKRFKNRGKKEKEVNP